MVGFAELSAGLREEERTLATEPGMHLTSAAIVARH